MKKRNIIIDGGVLLVILIILSYALITTFPSIRTIIIFGENFNESRKDLNIPPIDNELELNSLFSFSETVEWRSKAELPNRYSKIVVARDGIILSEEDSYYIRDHEKVKAIFTMTHFYRYPLKKCRIISMDTEKRETEFLGDTCDSLYIAFIKKNFQI